MGQVVSQFIADYGELLVEGVRDTIIMTAVATLLAYVIGLPVGVLLITSAKKGIRPNAPLNTVNNKRLDPLFIRNANVSLGPAGFTSATASATALA